MKFPSLGLLLAFVTAYAAGACQSVPLDDERRDNRAFPARGAMRGSIRYEGPRPCSRLGHVVGSVVIFVFQRGNPPPPTGFGLRPVNFTVVPGDELFVDEPRFTGPELSCPAETEVVSVSAPFALSPLEGGSYIVQAFYNRSGNFLPSFGVRNQPEAGDIAGGYIDVAFATQNAQNPNFQNVYFPVDIGIAQEIPQGAPPDTPPTYKIPSQGFVADSVLVSLFERVPLTRPYFNVALPAQPLGPTPENPDGDANFMPVLTMTQDHHVLAAPATPTKDTLATLEKSFVSARLDFGVPAAELDASLDPREPFLFQLEPSPSLGFQLFSKGKTIPENPLVPALWPEVVFTRLKSDPTHQNDPQALAVRPSPLVLIQGITLFDDALSQTTEALVPKKPGAPKDHVRVLVRPSALCIANDAGPPSAVLVTPYKTGKSADPAETTEKPLYDEARLATANGGLVRGVRNACLPTGRYAISALYPSGQSWTTPNESGSCAKSEGALDSAGSPGKCLGKPRAVLLSQGTRAVLEVVPPNTPEGRAFCEGAGRVPDECGSAP
jgi:hypothetical protein